VTVGRALGWLSAGLAVGSHHTAGVRWVIVILFPFILNPNNVDNGGSSLAVETPPIIPVAPHFLSVVIAVLVVTDSKFHDSSR
jgi:hypothetical protein